MKYVGKLVFMINCMTLKHTKRLIWCSSSAPKPSKFDPIWGDIMIKYGATIRKGSVPNKKKVCIWFLFIKSCFYLFMYQSFISHGLNIHDANNIGPYKLSLNLAPTMCLALENREEKEGGSPRCEPRISRTPTRDLVYTSLYSVL